MKVTVVSYNDVTFTVEVPEDMELVNFKVVCEMEAGGAGSSEENSGFVVIFNGAQLLDAAKTLKQYNIREGDLVVMQRIANSRETRAPAQNPFNLLGQDLSQLRNMLLSNPEQLAALRQQNPRLAETLSSSNPKDFEMEINRQRAEYVKDQQLFMKMSNSDPFDPEGQRLIAERIHQSNIDANMEAAIEHSPETFGSVTMLWINCKVNGFPMKAFVDSGAQQTIMSSSAAERCNIMRLVDKRFSGIARGVGSQKVLGRIHMVQIQIENDFLTSSLSVLGSLDMDMLLGLDMLKRHQCCIDLRQNFLSIGTTGTQTQFLSEAELPLCARMNEGMFDRNDNNPGDVPESVVLELVNMGFKREDVVNELRKFKGDKNQAMAALFAKSLKL